MKCSIFIFSFVNVNLIYLNVDNGSGILNVFETNKNKHLNTMQNHWVVQIRQHILAICLLKTAASFIRTTLYFVLESGLIGQQQKNLVRQKNHQLIKLPNVWCEVCIQTWGGFSKWWFFCTTRLSNCTREFSHTC